MCARLQNPLAPSFRTAPHYNGCFPSSEKVHQEVVHEPTGQVLHVPLRRVALIGGSGVFDIYDTSGPQVARSFPAACMPLPL